MNQIFYYTFALLIRNKSMQAINKNDILYLYIKNSENEIENLEDKIIQ